MSEHWKSTPKYWCKHCSIYVKDTPFERKQHENTGKHQGNLKRFLQGIHKDHQKNEREKERAKTEIERLNRVVGLAASSTTSSSHAPPKPPKTASTTLSAADQKRQWAQLADLGIAVPDHARAENAMAGSWQVVSTKAIEGGPPSEDKDNVSVGIRKRPFQNDAEEEETEDVVVRKGWGSTTKTYPGSKGTADDLGALLAAPLFKSRKKGRQDLPVLNDTTASPDLTAPKDEVVIKSDPSVAVPDPLTDPTVNSFNSATASSGPLPAGTKAETVQIAADNSQTPVFKKRKAKQPLSTRDPSE
ncbi:hypothetical protein LTS08_002140 [Lithohypha guttulata]|uniref:U1-type domain-containing protein n=1 Tax=Lithohypha guttulata TaxID=1690604 RepID=A0AAN7T7G9_9EURO|nr:hypothetical protein LTR05_001128 [Lithohypha guttulata]KAK5104253.1 hypothetical protein LTS08_002140 [Lithohypha guttulata]